VPGWPRTFASSIATPFHRGQCLSQESGPCSDSGDVAVRRLLGLYSLTLLVLFVVSARRLFELGPADAPLSLWSPFLKPLIGAACEMALLIAVPAAVLCARASGLGLRASVFAASVLLVPTIGAAVTLDTSSTAPGRVAQQLIDAARSTCPKSPERRVAVPLLPITWSCPRGAAPVASGRVPFGTKVDFSARTLRVSSDLRRIDLEQFTLEAPVSQTRLGLRLHTRRATLAGLAPWGRPRDLSSSGRLLRATLAGLAVLAAGLFLLQRRQVSAGAAAGLGLLSGALLVVLQSALDRFGAPVSSYWLGLLVGPLAVFALGFLGLAWQRWRGSRSAVARREG
jgi:hypothetical protein